MEFSMKALRIVLTQNKAHYRKEESLQNKMTYPLPPFSTVIGGIHSACGFKEYKPMDLSIQGNYQSLSRQPYTDYSFLNSVMDDRGILVKVKNPNLLSSSFEKVASAMKSQGNSFKDNITINIHNQVLMEEYWQLKKANDKAGLENYKSLTTSLKYYEILHEVKLIIHVKADEDILVHIYENIYNLKSLGRSEDFVDVEECEIVQLHSSVEKEKRSLYTAYLNAKLVKEEHIFLRERGQGIPASGTKYWINKCYSKEKGYRKFEKVPVVFASNYMVDEQSEGIFFDEKGGYIVDFN